MDVVLVEPEIPHNSGCAGRLTAALGVRLHLVEPLGFVLEDRYLKRAGLDYWSQVDLTVHPDLATCWAHLAAGSERPLEDRIQLFSARGGTSLFEATFAPDDVLVFGSESKGLADAVLEAFPDRHVYLPIRPGIRSLNLANTVAVGLYHALWKSGSPLPDNDGSHEPPADRDAQPVDIARRTGPAD